MLNSSIHAHGATTTRTRTPAPAISNRDAAGVIARLMHAEGGLASYYGRKLRGLVPALFDADGRTPLSTYLRLMKGSTGFTGFMLGNVAADYGTPENGPYLYQASNQNLARGLATMPAEELLARGIAEIRLPPELAEELMLLGIEVEKLPLRIAHKIAYGVVSETVANAIPASRLGALNLFRSHAPTIRFGLIELLFASADSDRVRDMLIQAPILALAPGLLAHHVGEKPKTLLRELGLPVEARRLQARALSPLRYWMLHDGRDLADGDMRWMTPALLNDLPKSKFAQYRVITLAFDLLLAGLDDAAVAERVIWAARNAADLFKGKVKPPLAEWMRASDSFLSRAAIKEWHPKISADTALEAAKAAAVAYEIEGGTTAEFPLPHWAIWQRLPKSKWWLQPIGHELDLFAAGRRNANCVAAYVDACRSGAVTICEIRRPITKRKGPKLPVVDGLEVGAVIEVARRWGCWQLIQMRGYANGDVLPPLARAVRRFVAALNGEVR
jgi:hypothetical protein